MKYLFFFVHPSKYFLLRDVIKKLNSTGHQTDILITGKQNLEELVKSENWNYTNIFPCGRRTKNLPTYINAIYNSIRTIYRLLKYTKNKNYDLFITDDFLSIIGKLRNTPSILITDNDFSSVPESFILLKCATYILSPAIADQKRFEFKKIGYYGYKALAHLHRNIFTPSRELLMEPLKSGGDYFFIRCVSVTSTHDVGNKGIGDELLKKIVGHLKDYGSIIISSERKLPVELEKYSLDFKNDEAAHHIAFSKIFISDSTTMCAEAAVLGVPSIEIDDWYENFGQYKNFNGKYGLIHGFRPEEEEKIFNKIDEMLANKNLYNDYQSKRKRLLDDTIDVSAFIYWFIVKYPESVVKFKENPEIQLRFRL